MLTQISSTAPQILSSIHMCCIEIISSSCITVWRPSCTTLDRKAVQQVIQAAEFLTGNKWNVYHRRHLREAHQIHAGHTRPATSNPAVLYPLEKTWTKYCFQLSAGSGQCRPQSHQHPNIPHSLISFVYCLLLTQMVHFVYFFPISTMIENF